MTDVDLNAPAFGPGSQKIEPKEEAPKVSEETKVEEEKAPEAEAEESKVPYSRFKKFHDEALKLREEAEHWRQIAETNKPAERETESEIPSYWKELYGDSEASIKAWKIQSGQNEALIEKARQEAIEAVRSERLQEVERVEKNVEVLNNNFETLSDYIGRKLTDKEESAVLDIIDEYTPKGPDGNYSGDIIPIEKAWEIYEMKTQAETASKRAAKDSVASLSGVQSQGEPSQKAEADKNWNPLDWNAWRKKI